MDDSPPPVPISTRISPYSKSSGPEKGLYLLLSDGSYNPKIQSKLQRNRGGLVHYPL